MPQSLSFQDAAEQVKQQLNVLDTIGRFVSLKKRGRSHLGLCPFHNERTPSFNVSAEKGFFKCFGCGESGDSISFLMKIEHKTYGEVIREQAEEMGLEIRYNNAVEDQAQYAQKTEERERLWDVLHNAGQWFHMQIQSPQHQAIREYLLERGTSQEAVKRFQLGYAPETWEALNHYLHTACPHVASDASILERASVAGVRDNGKGYYDKFRHRLMVPIHDLKGRIVGFGGRALGNDQQPKYLNSSESMIYQKSQILYGLFQAKDAIRKRKRAVVMEGYFDVIASHMAGLQEAVATCGTALTEAHIPLLIKSGVEILYLCFDSDLAGRNAALNALERLDPWIQRQTLKIRVLSIPSGKDPDDYFKTHTLTEFETLMANAPDGLSFRLDCVLEGVNTHHAEGQLEASHRLLPLLSKVKHPILRAQLLAKYAERLHLPEETLRQSLALFEGKSSSKSSYTTSAKYTKSHDKNKRYTAKTSMPPEDFSRLRQPLLKQQTLPMIEQNLLSMALSHGAIFEGLQKSLVNFAWQSPTLNWLWQQVQGLPFGEAQPYVQHLWLEAQRQNKLGLSQAVEAVLIGQDALLEQLNNETLSSIQLLQMVNESLVQWQKRKQQSQLYVRNKAFRSKEHDAVLEEDLDAEAILLHYDVLDAHGS
jgi:DNA primase catalytic core